MDVWDKHVPSPLLVVDKRPLLDIPASAYFADSISADELSAKTEAARAAGR